MNYTLIALGLACFVVTVAAYEFNQTPRADWLMDLVGVVGYLCLIAAPILIGIGSKTF